MTETPVGRPEDGQPDWAPPTWDEVVRTHSARVYRLAYRLTGNPYDAEDLTQDVFVRVFRSLSSYTPGTFEGWLHRITTNLFLDQVRRKQRIRFDALGDDAGDRLAGREPEPGPGLRRPALRPRRPAAPWTSCRPTSARRSCSATSRACPTRRSPPRSGIKLGTVRSRIHRGRSQLRAALEHRAAGRRPADIGREGPP